MKVNSGTKATETFIFKSRSGFNSSEIVNYRLLPCVWDKRPSSGKVTLNKFVVSSRRPSRNHMHNDYLYILVESPTRLLKNNNPN